ILADVGVATIVRGGIQTDAARRVAHFFGLLASKPFRCRGVLSSRASAPLPPNFHRRLSWARSPTAMVRDRPVSVAADRNGYRAALVNETAGSGGASAGSRRCLGVGRQGELATFPPRAAHALNAAGGVCGSGATDVTGSAREGVMTQPVHAGRFGRCWAIF